MKLFSTALFSGLITLVKLAAAFIVTKVVALYIGAPGVAVVGSFTNFITIVLAFSNASINNGIVKYTAEYINHPGKTQRLFSTSFRISIVCSFFVSLILLLFSKRISSLLFFSPFYSDVIIVFAFTLVFYSLNQLLVSIVNGKSEIKLLTVINIIGSIISLIITVALVFYFGLKGALYALVLTQTLVFFISFLIVFKKKWLTLSEFLHPFDKKMLHRLSAFTIMATISAIMVPVTQIAIRNTITSTLGIDNAGFWQGMMRISDSYLMIANIALATYFLPKFSQLRSRKEINTELLNGYKLLVPFTVFSCITLYFFRYPVINLLFSSKFFPMSVLFKWQLLGDIFKVCAFVLSYLMLAKAKIKIYIITEVLFSALYFVLSFFLIHSFGLEGTTMAFAVVYFLYFLCMLFLFLFKII
ncbi:O-antigen translocase [Chryseobacterium taklimakanense]|uniref:O-antigen translocase n=1 Tax=Chryseobacterium taklimakanense TaxID=536441 RepID=A0A3G8WNR3_9FLAO|nr:O-antigen translocase [Chryseobacterium taklimakanense]AZI19814.1 O-antigen translocase [Chryseobacterium taklimakanense]